MRMRMISHFRLHSWRKPMRWGELQVKKKIIPSFLVLIFESHGHRLCEHVKQKPDRMRNKNGY